MFECTGDISHGLVQLREAEVCLHYLLSSAFDTNKQTNIYIYILINVSEIRPQNNDAGQIKTPIPSLQFSAVPRTYLWTPSACPRTCTTELCCSVHRSYSARVSTRRQSPLQQHCPHATTTVSTTAHESNAPEPIGILCSMHGTRMHSCTHAYTSLCIHIYMHTYINAFIHGCIHTHMHSYILANGQAGEICINCQFSLTGNS
jgi:hypothetical protein